MLSSKSTADTQKQQLYGFSTNNSNSSKTISKSNEILKELSDNCNAFQLKMDDFLFQRKADLDKKMANFRSDDIEFKNSKQKLQDFLSIKVKELNELSERESLLAENLATVCADVENDLSAQNEQVSHQLTLLKSQNNSLNVEVADRKHALEMKLKLDENKRKIQEPALEFYQKAFGMHVLPVQENRVRFIFTCIDQNDLDKEFSFDMVILETYSVVRCEPKLFQLDILVAQLNESRDFSEFLKQMRSAFCVASRAQ